MNFKIFFVLARKKLETSYSGTFLTFLTFVKCKILYASNLALAYLEWPHFLLRRKQSKVSEGRTQTVTTEKLMNYALFTHPFCTPYIQSTQQFTWEVFLCADTDTKDFHRQKWIVLFENISQISHYPENSHIINVFNLKVHFQSEAKRKFSAKEN